MSELQPQVDALFMMARKMAAELTEEATKEQLIEYESVLMELAGVWWIHHKKTMELINKCIWKLEENKRKYFSHHYQ